MRKTVIDINVEITGFVAGVFFINTKLSGRFALIFLFNCDHFLFVYIVKQLQKSSGIFKI